MANYKAHAELHPLKGPELLPLHDCRTSGNTEFVHVHGISDEAHLVTLQPAYAAALPVQKPVSILCTQVLLK